MDDRVEGFSTSGRHYANLALASQTWAVDPLQPTAATDTVQVYTTSPGRFTKLAFHIHINASAPRLKFDVELTNYLWDRTHAAAALVLEYVCLQEEIGPGNATTADRALSATTEGPVLLGHAFGRTVERAQLDGVAFSMVPYIRSGTRARLRSVVEADGAVRMVRAHVHPASL